MLRPNHHLSLSHLHFILWGAFMTLTVGCSIQKRTHLPGFHVEHRSRQAAKSAHPAPTNQQTPGETMAEALAFTSAKADDVVAFEVVPDRTMAGLNMHEMKSTVATAIARQSFNPPFLRRPGLQTQILRSFAPEVDLDEARAMAWDESCLGFGLGILFLLSTFLLFPAVLSASGAIMFGGLGAACLFSGVRINRLAKDDARLAAWYEKRMAQLARNKQRSEGPGTAAWTWWKWLLFVLALLLGLATLVVIFFAILFAMSGL